MSKHWKVRYSLELAKACGIHTSEGGTVTNWGNTPEWIYHVEVVNFTFSFFSLEMLDDYIDFFNWKILPHKSQSQFTDGAAASIGDGQSPFERLPAKLRKKSVKPKVMKALMDARDFFLTENR